MEIDKINKLAISGRISGGITEGCFPLTIKKLRDRTCKVAFMTLIGNKKLSNYVSIVDCLFCESFPIPWRALCRKFYVNPDTHGQKVINIEKKRSILWYDIIMSRIILNECKDFVDNELQWNLMMDLLRTIIKNRSGPFCKPLFTCRGYVNYK